MVLLIQLAKCQAEGLPLIPITQVNSLRHLKRLMPFNREQHKWVMGRLITGQENQILSPLLRVCHLDLTFRNKMHGVIMAAVSNWLIRQPITRLALNSCHWVILAIKWVAGIARK